MIQKNVKVEGGEKTIPIPEVGDSVIYVNPYGQEVPALVTIAHCNEHWGYAYGPCVNLVLVSLDITKSDNYGRQVERVTSIPHCGMQGLAHGNYYKYPGEVKA